MPTFSISRFPKTKLLISYSNVCMGTFSVYILIAMCTFACGLKAKTLQYIRYFIFCGSFRRKFDLLALAHTHTQIYTVNINRMYRRSWNGIICADWNFWGIYEISTNLWYHKIYLLGHQTINFVAQFLSAAFCFHLANIICKDAF